MRESQPFQEPAFELEGEQLQPPQGRGKFLTYSGIRKEAIVAEIGMGGGRARR